MFTVSVWNMHHPASWEYFDRALTCDIALLQEMPPSPERRGVQKVVPHPGKRPWGSAVITDHPYSELETVSAYRSEKQVPPIRSNPDAVIAALVKLPDKKPVVAVSLYGIQEGNRYSLTAVHRAL